MLNENDVLVQIEFGITPDNNNIIIIIFNGIIFVINYK